MSSPFNWQGAPSLVGKDPRFTGRGKAQRTQSQIVSATVARITKETGRNPGKITGLSREEKILASRWGSPYLKPGSGK